MTYVAKKPWRSAWHRHGETFLQRGPNGVETADVWACPTRMLMVLSSVHYATFRGVVRPQYQVSVSTLNVDLARPRRRATDEECAYVLAAFGMVGAEEDNHEAGVARHFWRLCDVAPDAEMPCDCKETDEIVVEPDGHVWSRPRAGVVR